MLLVGRSLPGGESHKVRPLVGNCLGEGPQFLKQVLHAGEADLERAGGENYSSEGVESREAHAGIDFDLNSFLPGLGQRYAEMFVEFLFATNDPLVFVRRLESREVGEGCTSGKGKGSSRSSGHAADGVHDSVGTSAADMKQGFYVLAIQVGLVGCADNLDNRAKPMNPSLFGGHFKVPPMLYVSTLYVPSHGKNNLR